MRAVVMTATGGREVLEQIERPEPVAGPGEALVEIAVAGVNFMDIGVRQGIAWTDMPNPKILGVEGVGRVLAVGEGFEAVQPGQRVAWVYAPGSYAERIAIPATSLVPVPDAVDDRTAASIMMQGLTASHFATDFYPVQPGDVAFVHAAAGGVGLLLTQIIKLRGGRVIGRVSSEDKVAVAREVGADHVIVDTEGRFAEEARNLIENALKHGVRDEPVAVTLSADGCLRVTNAGPVVPSAVLARLSEPFERGQALVRGPAWGSPSPGPLLPEQMDG
ncbi:alcohol dehydrogenase catalytic domain-containing protein [Rhizobium rhizoryzae]|uniref:alcohol dehydrogenase catalytic domain-containing protein n=1 Tax=Rhizobium rhizoryzae TaxID=451876 RepID=UPI0028A7A8AC|nr:alcohol dehydrogenase catalytic domain-containing protein [Rhizobium rhizoryzae]